MKVPALASILKGMYPAAIDPLALNRRPPQPCKRWIRIVYLVASVTALLVALYLTVMKLTGQITDLAGCGGDGGCASVLGGRWANWLRVPISVWSLGIYLPLLVLGVFGLTTPAQRRLALIGTSILVAAAGWFLYIQAVVEGQFCPYCLVMHLCGVAMFASVLVDVWSRDMTERAASFFLAGGVASLAMMALVTGQFFGPQPDTHTITIEDQLAEMAAQTVATRRAPAEAATAEEGSAADSAARREDASQEQTERTGAERQSTRDVADAPPKSDLLIPDSTQESTAASGQGTAGRGREVSYFDGAIKLSVDDVPLIGRPDARHILLKYFDYTCSSCRRMHLDLAAAVEAYPEDLAVIVIPCPLNDKCNPHADPQASRTRGPGSHEFACELARLALAMWRVAPEEFERFHNELFARQSRMTPAAAILVGDAMIAPRRLEDAVHDPWIDSLLDHSTEIYGRMKKSNPRMPKVLLGERKVLHGVVVSTDALIDLLRQQFQLDGLPE